MKILIVINSNFLTTIGGSQIQALRLANGFKNQGHHVSILTKRDKGLPKEETHGGILIERKIFAPPWGKLFGIFYLLFCIVYMLRYRNKFDVFYARFIYLESIAAGFLKTLGLLKIPFMATGELSGANLLFPGDIYRLSHMKLARFWRWWILKIDSFNDLGSEELHAEFLEYGIPRDKIVSIPNAVDALVFRPLEKKNNLGKIKILYLGRLVKQKGVEYLLRAWQRIRTLHTKAEVHIVGDGAEKRNLQHLTQELGIEDAVIFYDATSKPETYMQENDIFINPSLAEGFGVTIAEAMMCRLAVIATRCAWLKDLPDREIALLIDPGNVEQITQALSLLIEDAKLRRDIAQKGYRYALEHFETNQVVRKYIQSFKEMARK